MYTTSKINFKYYKVKKTTSHLLAPVQTIFPELKMRAVVLGSRILMMTAAKRWKVAQLHQR